MSLFCSHATVRCLHGDEIILRMSPWRRAVPRQACVDCGKTLYRPLPEVCTITFARHDGAL